MSKKIKLESFANNPLIEIVGWLAAVMILVAYALVSLNFITPNSLIYQVLNLTGSLGLVAVALPDKAWQPVALNIVWAILAVIALIRII